MPALQRPIVKAIGRLINRTIAVLLGNLRTLDNGDARVLSTGDTRVSALANTALSLSGTPLALPSGIINVYYSYSIASVFTGTVDSYTLVGTLPTGVTFDTATGLISGTPTEFFTGVISVLANNVLISSLESNKSLLGIGDGVGAGLGSRALGASALGAGY